MEIKEIKKDVYACLQEENGLGCSNAGFVNLGGGLTIDTFYDLNLTRQMIELYKKISNKPINCLVNTHHNGDHTWGNQLFKDSEIIAHQLCAEEMEKEKENNLPRVFLSLIKKFEVFPPQIQQFVKKLKIFDFTGIEITLPNHLIEDRFNLDLDGYPCQLIYVGPAHSSGDLIVHLPEYKVIFAGDIVFSQCTPIGWEGTHDKWIKALDLIISLEPEVIVPGHGPLCGIEVVKDLRAYFEFVYSEAKHYFDEGLDPFETSKKIDIGSYAKWTGPERLFMNVNRAYREFRNAKTWNEPFNALELFGKCYELWVHRNKN